VAALRRVAHLLSDWRDMPVDDVRWVPVEKVRANDYNPNAVAKNEMRLLSLSITEDGYTQPIVTVYDEETDIYVVVDGFHRYTVGKTDQAIRERCAGHVPVVVIDKGMAGRMAATVRHNRARGKHSIAGMASLVFQMLDEGRTDADICNDLGMEPDELLRLKHVTGFSKLFANVSYRQAWEARSQIKIRQDWEAANGKKVAL
jgi:ParB-like chromosome segregation protein Spo0J